MRPLLERRKTYRAAHVFLLAHPTRLGQVSARMLSERWDKARRLAVADPENAKIAGQLRKMILRDMRKFSAQLVPSLADARALLQHSSEKITADHYRPQAEVVKAAR